MFEETQQAPMRTFQMTIHLGTTFRGAAIGFLDVVASGGIPGFRARVIKLIFSNAAAFIFQIHILIIDVERRGMKQK
jgi:hypothetical protein